MPLLPFGHSPITISVVTQGFIDNKTSLVKDDLVRTIREGDRISIAAASFSMYAYRELREQLESASSFRFIYTSKTFTEDATPKEQREFYIPRLEREQNLYGTPLEIRLRNELTQKAIATECADWIRRKKARFMSFDEESDITPSLVVEHADEKTAYMPFNEFTTTQLGVSRHAASYQGVAKMEDFMAEGFLDKINEAWSSGDLHDVTDKVIDGIERMYQENPPELVYYMALYRIFSEFLDDISEDVLPKEGTGFRESLIWNKLYDFQKDAALAIINKLETYNGCILADSVGLGKTFTALAVVKYFEARNRNVLVLCPKKLKDNWVTYRSNATNNPIAGDHLRYDVLFHTDLSRTRGDTIMNIPIERINWGNYDLVVIDESHNFRNGADSAAKADDKENRYQKLLNKVIHSGVPTKVLMLSATPVNNRFRDLQNQLELAYGDKGDEWSRKLGLSTNIDMVFRNAQKAYGVWSKLEPEERNTKRLMDMLDFDFFRILDQVTVARSRRHIRNHYDMDAIGGFPERLRPQTIRPALSTESDCVSYDEIYDELERLTLALYTPSEFVLESRMSKYFDDDKIEGLTIRGRETGVRKLMATNLLKRFESSVHSFRMTLDRVLGYMSDTVGTIDSYEEYRAKHYDTGVLEQIDIDRFDDGFDLDQDDTESVDPDEFATKGKTRFLLSDMDWRTWRDCILRDMDVIHRLLDMVAGIDAAHDAKLQRLYRTISDKQNQPINPGNHKILIFTAFADTADYLYEHVSKYAGMLGLNTAEVTGTNPGRCTVKKVGGRMSDILACFSPISKERDITVPRLKDTDIDILIATDCISEGQNLQDCDMMVNYDIHWNPVRIIQRFGRIDRIGSTNKRIQLVNYWPDVDLDKYLKLKDRVEARMKVAVMASTGDDDYINPDEKGDLEYRERQLRQMQDEVPDLEDMDGGVSITDLGLNEFRMDLVGYHRDNPDIERTPTGINAVVEGDEPGILFVLRNTNRNVKAVGRNPIHPYYLVHVGDDGRILHGHLNAKDCLDVMRKLCKGKDTYDPRLCRAYNRFTHDGRDMRHASVLLRDAVKSIMDQDDVAAADSFFTGTLGAFLDENVKGLDDFELVCFLVIRPATGDKS